jgi:hypothetical protein
MTRRAQAGLLAGLALAVTGFLIWRVGMPPEEREVRRRLAAFVSEFNTSTTDGLGTLARAVRLGEYFSTDVVVELGQGSPPIHGRETLTGMAARLQPRTAAFVLELDDVTVEILDGTRADVTMTALIRRRSLGSGEESLDAREFSAEVRKTDGQWVVTRVVAVDTLR